MPSDRRFIQWIGKPSTSKIPSAPNGKRWCAGCRAFVELKQFAKSPTVHYHKHGVYYSGAYCNQCREENKVRQHQQNLARQSRCRLQRRIASMARYVKMRANGGRHTKKEWEDLKAQYGNQCLRCGGPNVIKDHVVPVKCGGSDSIENIQPLCRACNQTKGTKTTDYRTKGRGIVS